MEKIILKITALGLFAAVIIATPIASHAQDATTPAATTTTKKAKKITYMTFSDYKVSAVDTNAMTLTVGKYTFNVTSETKLTKDGQPATLADVTVGGKATGFCKTGTDGKLTATTVDYSTKPAGTKKKKKSATETAGSTTNSITK
jgi:hypothetical protein